MVPRCASENSQWSRYVAQSQDNKGMADDSFVIMIYDQNGLKAKLDLREIRKEAREVTSRARPHTFRYFRQGRRRRTKQGYAYHEEPRQTQHVRLP